MMGTENHSRKQVSSPTHPKFCETTMGVSWNAFRGADPAAGKGGGQIINQTLGSRGLAPWQGLQGGSASLHREMLHL